MYICWYGILPCGAYGKLRQHQYPQPVSGKLSRWCSDGDPSGLQDQLRCRDIRCDSKRGMYDMYCGIQVPWCDDKLWFNGWPDPVYGCDLCRFWCEFVFNVSWQLYGQYYGGQDVIIPVSDKRQCW